MGFLSHFLTRKTILRVLLVLGFLIPVYFFLYKIYIPRVNAFGCFDDCFNYVGAFFMMKGRSLYSEIFFNHQMLMAYVSYFIQSLTHPESIYELILRHRQFLLFYGFLMNFLLIFRFGFPAVGFVLLYEFSKYYLFGDRFLSEGLIVYPLVYLFGVVFEKQQHGRVRGVDLALSGIFAWLVVFMREPYAPLAVILLFLLSWQRPLSKFSKLPVTIFAFLSIITVASQPLHDYFFNVVTVNFQTFFVMGHQADSFAGGGILKTIFYPVFIFFDGQWNFYRYFLIGLTVVFLVLVVHLVRQRNFKLFLLLFSILAFSNLRAVEVGKIYYEAFHMLPWYSLFVFSICMMLYGFYAKTRVLALSFVVFLVGLFGYLIFSPGSYIHDKVDPHTDLITNYGKELQVGSVVKILSHPTDSLFLDGFDDLIYFQAQRQSIYPYSWYTAIMPNFPVYLRAREQMFSQNPPDFYYGSCPKSAVTHWIMPKKYMKQYVRLLQGENPSCLFIKKTKLASITQGQWNTAEKWDYFMPKLQ